MIYEMPKPLWTICSIPAGRVLPGVGGLGADRFPGGAVHQHASRKHTQTDGGSSVIQESAKQGWAGLPNKNDCAGKGETPATPLYRHP